MYIGLHVKYPLILSGFNEAWILTDFGRILTDFGKILCFRNFGNAQKNLAGKIKLRIICVMDLSRPTGPSTCLLNSVRIRKSMWTRFLNSVVWTCQTLHVSRLLVHLVPLISYNLQNPDLIACFTVTFVKMLSQFRVL